MNDFGTRLRVTLLCVALLGLATVVGASPASAVPAGTQCAPDDVYCSTTSTPSTEPGVTAICVVSTPSGTPGTRVDVLISGVPSGLAIRLDLNGSTVATGQARDTGTTDDVAMSFVVPALAPGSYPLVAVGTNFLVECLAGTGFEVGGTAITRPRGGGGGSLARTGITIAVLLAVALALLVIGRVMVETSRRRRRAARAARGLPAEPMHGRERDPSHIGR